MKVREFVKNSYRVNNFYIPGIIGEKPSSPNVMYHVDPSEYFLMYETIDENESNPLIEHSPSAVDNILQNINNNRVK